MKKQQLIFIAGKYRGNTNWEIECNIRRAETNGLMVARISGLVPIIPHTMYRFFQGELTDSFWLEATLNILDRCDAIFMLPGWEDSEGAKAEHQFALEKGIPIFLSFGPMVRYYADLFEGDKTQPVIE